MLPANLLLQNRFRIVRQIGQGSMGVVYEAVDERLGHQVAIKQILRRDRDTFAHESQLLARLHHPILPSVNDFFSEDAGHFLVMELIPGDDLAAMRLRQPERFTPAQVLVWAGQLLDGITYLHNQHPPVLHRDIKPANLKLINDNHLILLDFGLAKGKVDETSQEQKSVIGYTLTYASPEQIGQQGTDARSDLYSAAATFFYLFTGRHPADAMKRASALMVDQPDPLFMVYQDKPNLSLGLIAVLRKAMSLNPAERYASASDLWQAMQRANNEQTLIVTPVLPAVPSPITVANNIPISLTSLVGREREIADIQAMLRGNNIRLLTLTGTGGVGKTRLAQEVATQLLSDFTDGVFQISLASITDANLVISAIAQILEVHETGGTTLLTSLQEHLREKSLLLLIDNFEQVIDAAPILAELLMAAPRLKLLVTSRERLHVRGEHEFAVSPLVLPDLAHLPRLETLAQVAAVDLFVQCAQAGKPNFVLDPSNAAIVAELCIQLDGLPLAIELAAARIKLLSPQEMLVRLADRFKFLRGGARDLPARQQTLQATLEWSYELLTEAEKRLFRRLSVFVGGCTLDALEQVCNPVGTDEMVSLGIEAVDGVSTLLDKSLVRQEVGADGEPRFSMLTSIREYASYLVGSAESEVIYHKYADYYRILADNAEPELIGTNQKIWMDRLETEHDNLRSVLSWAITNTESEMALRLGWTLWRFWGYRDHLTEGRNWLDKILTRGIDGESGLRANALNAAGNLAHWQGDNQQAIVFYNEALALQKIVGNKESIAVILNNLGNIADEQGDYVTAQAYHQECLVLLRELNIPWRTATSLNNLANVLQDQGNCVEAGPLYEESLQIFRQLEDQYNIVNLLINLVRLAYNQDNYTAANEYGHEALKLSRDLLYSWGIAASLQLLGDTARKQGDYSTAHSWLVESLSILKEIGDKREIVSLLDSFGYLSSVYLTPEYAPLLLASADLLRKTINIPRAPISSCDFSYYTQIVRQKLGEDTYSRLWMEGQSITLEQAIEYALHSETANSAEEPNLLSKSNEASVHS